MFFYLGTVNTQNTYEQNAENVMFILARRWFNVQAFYQCGGSGAGRVRIRKVAAAHASSGV
jgi:hypothetical protein